MIRRILIYPGIYPTSGIGNVMRMFNLSVYVHEKLPDAQIDFLVRNEEKISSLLSNNNFINLIKVGSSLGDYEVALYDSIKVDNELLKEMNQLLKKQDNRLLTAEEQAFIANLFV